MSLWSVPPLAIRATHAPQMPPRHVAGRSRPLWSAASARRVAQIEAEKSLATQTRLIAVGHSLRANWLTRPDIWTYGKIKSTRATFHAWGVSTPFRALFLRLKFFKYFNIETASRGCPLGGTTTEAMTAQAESQADV
eukprot:scaffold43204_cov21-Tisochrysis_lutea.AAC.1